MHKIRIINLQEKWWVDYDALRRAAEKTLNRFLKDPVKINIVIMDNAQIRKPNAQFLDHDYETDVLAFRYGRSVGGTDGEVLVSVEQAHVEARERRIPPEEELLRYVIHGCLHFLGFRDKSPKDQKEMFRHQESILKELGLKNRSQRKQPGKGI